ncbi:hypothetical protein GCM10018785_67050 [Streptomyces longispororuber]|uniref:Uncharacterized protein n=1 Tax=Streptomyces longispororuber TaxID=68230 RepID=A0A919A824_9ACTN|nr:hypothetical protein [Streptomyces longispororuber]GHE90953.1 hypothetical protein GCM10018785_67050 [Streptomyces longispororuber]
MKRKMPVLLAALALAGLGAAVPAAAAQAAPSREALDTSCRAAWSHTAPGNMAAYPHSNCRGYLGSTGSWDSDWGNNSGPFRGGDTNQASAVLNKGTSGMAVAVYNGTGTDWGGGYACLARSESYASNLNDDRFHNGVSANDAISSHRWVRNAQCYGHWLR